MLNVTTEDVFVNFGVDKLTITALLTRHIA
jgi:hypothetical protein